jgi:hypothetical protein
VSAPQIRVRTRSDVARQRRYRTHPCWDHLSAAPLWPMHGVNPGTQTGMPAEALDLLDAAVEIPMIGTGASLNVAVAGSLVLYRLAGFL